VYKKNAAVISSAYRSYHAGTPGKPEDVSVQHYSGANEVAIRIARALQEKAGAELIGAYVHGSIGTGEEISYSDFDGLVIVNNGCMSDPDRLFRLVLALKETEQMMTDMDPLQHHGWFVLTEKDLECYPENYFPLVLFQYAKCLFGSKNFRVTLNSEGYAIQFKKTFYHLADSILHKLETNSFLENNYVFKNLLSEFMLLPAVYFQAKTGNGIFKKFSFEKIENETGEKFEVMRTISLLRQQWNFMMPASDIERMKKQNPFASQRYAKHHAGKLPVELKNIFSAEFINQMRSFVFDLTNRMEK